MPRLIATRRRIKVVDGCQITFVSISGLEGICAQHCEATLTLCGLCAAEPLSHAYGETIYIYIYIYIFMRKDPSIFVWLELTTSSPAESTEHRLLL